MQLTDYEVLCIIGSGSFGVCYKVKHKRNNEVYVWKAIDYGCMSEDQKQLLVSEVNLLKELKHPNIVQYYDRIIHTETQVLYIIMECCEQGDLGKLITKCKETNSYIEENFIWRVLYQTAKALQACHTHKSKLTVLHRDIKPANVFLDKNGNVKLGDFGLARVVKKNSFSETIVGTPNYMSPELIKGEKYNKKSDIWSLGCLIYELCALHPPFHSDNFNNLSDNIKQGRFRKIPSHYSEDLHKVIKLMLNIDCTYRPTVEIIIHHPTVLSNLSSEFGSPNLVKNNVKKRLSFLEKLNSTENIYQNDLSLKFVNRASKSDTESMVELRNIDQTCNNKEPSWLSKLEDVRLREINLKIAEEKLKEKEKMLMKKEKQIEVLNKLAKEKLAKAEALIKNYRSGKFLRPRRKAQKIDYLDLDSTLSADTGDCSSVIMPAVKLKPISELNIQSNLNCKISCEEKPSNKIINDIPVHKTNLEILKDTINEKLNDDPGKQCKKKNLLSMFKPNNKQNKDPPVLEQQKNNENKENIPVVQDISKHLSFAQNIEKASVWNADNKKAAFELLAMLNAKSNDNFNVKNRNQGVSRSDNRRKSMIVLKKSTVL